MPVRAIVLRLFADSAYCAFVWWLSLCSALKLRGMALQRAARPSSSTRTGLPAFILVLTVPMKRFDYLVVEPQTALLDDTTRSSSTWTRRSQISSESDSHS